ncbi:MOSC domain-containing protein [Deinococcus cellulosilyticus]|nr:MOSC domain-containing protein [Deinococcus cellulosilyticus]
MILQTLSIGQAQEHPYQSGLVSSAIVKSSTSEPLQLTLTGLVGDQQADLRYHGGPDKAICVYPAEHYAFWKEKLGRELPVPGFGENFTTLGLLEAEVCIGDVYQVGEVRVQVTQPRQPCFKLAMRHGIKDLAVQVTESGFTGFYLRVLQEGTVQAGDAITLLEKGRITITETNRVIHVDRNDRAAIEQLLLEDALAATLRDGLQKRLQ